jgi:1-acyl-sn-glycerol-3-phosphate acyltransferase
VLYAFVKGLVLAIMRGYFRLETRGAAHVPASGPALLVSNHASVLDPPAIGSATERQLCFMAKAELFRVPLLGRLIRGLGARPVRRETASTQALKDALGLLKEGRALLMFPEGTRGAEGAVRSARPGAGMLAVMSGAPVVPVYISGTGRALPRGRAFPRPAKVRIAFGPPLVFKSEPQREGKERYRQAAEEMMRAIAQLRDQVEERAADSPDGLGTVSEATHGR